MPTATLQEPGIALQPLGDALAVLIRRESGSIRALAAELAIGRRRLSDLIAGRGQPVEGCIAQQLGKRLGWTTDQVIEMDSVNRSRAERL